VVIHPNGTWTNKDIDTDHPDAKLLNNNNPRRPSPVLERRLSSFGPPKAEVVSLDDDDEETGAPTPASLPPLPSRLSSTSIRASPAVTTPSRKRGPPAVVDLTLSDDEDEQPPARNPHQIPPPKRIRIDPPMNLKRASTDSLSRSNPLMNGVSPSPSAIRESQIRSPPSSISPRNESTNVFRYNNQSTGIMEPNQLFMRPSDFTFSNSNSTSTLHTLPTPSVTSPIQSRPALPSPTFNRQYLNSNPVSVNPTNERQRSLSPVLPAFRPPTPRPQSSNAFTGFDWEAFQNPVLNGTSGTWDESRDDLEDEEFDLEMARIPSDIFYPQENLEDDY
jgi:hypothetical protein